MGDTPIRGDFGFPPAPGGGFPPIIGEQGDELSPEAAGTDTATTTGGSMPAGALAPYGGTAAPTGWLLCDGSAVSRTTYADLFAVISTTYGAGDGSTTFNVPDLRQRFPLGKATAGTGSTLGGTGGNVDHTHAVSDGAAGSHTHTATSAGTHTHDSHSSAGNTAVQGVNTRLTGPTGSHTSDGDHPHSTDSQGNHSHDITESARNPPFQTFNYIIKH